MLGAEGADVRRDGYAICEGFIHPDAAAVAVPLRDVNGHVAAAISVIVPNDGQAYSLVRILQMTSRVIARQLPSQ